LVLSASELNLLRAAATREDLHTYIVRYGTGERSTSKEAVQASCKLDRVDSSGA
jgi:hypothetical protein